MLSTRKKTDSVIKVVSSQNVHTFEICEQILCVGPINGVLNMIDF